MFIAAHKHDPKVVWGLVYHPLVYNKRVVLFYRDKYYMCIVFIIYFGVALYGLYSEIFNFNSIDRIESSQWLV